jgi:putative transposase
LFDYPPAIRRAIYTTNAIESLNYSLGFCRALK